MRIGLACSTTSPKEQIATKDILKNLYSIRDSFLRSRNRNNKKLKGREFGVWVDGGRDFLVCCVDNLVSEVLSQLQDWNNRRQFTPPSDFHADGVNEFFNSQAVTDGSRANEILKQAPFLLPFTSRVKIFH
ncbi:hypothetical protein ACOSQ4_029675 [Xanthoceras sorbifolium]